MEKYSKKNEGNSIVFKDIVNNTELIVTHYDEDNIFDSIIVDERYDIDFVNYVVNELKKTNDLVVMFFLYYSKKLEKILSSNNLITTNYQYILKNNKYLKVNGYDISDNLDVESKAFYLKTINKLSLVNFKRFNPNKEFKAYNESYFNNKEYSYRIYRKNDKIAGIVDYKVFDNDPNYGEPINDVFNYNNKICIRSLLGDENAYEDIFKDLINTYKKDIVINVMYSEESLRKVIEKMNGSLSYCQYSLVKN